MCAGIAKYFGLEAIWVRLTARARATTRARITPPPKTA
ncbi:MAG: PspC domain-containing protein [Thermaceae bacterium]|nr:PspC domain-containing protein [Thermaceae bacterium]